METKKNKYYCCHFLPLWRGLWSSAFVFLFILNLRPIAAAQTAHRMPLITPMQNNVFIKERGQFSKHAAETKTPFTKPVLYGIENAEFNAYFTTRGIIFQFPERKKLKKGFWEKKREEREREGKGSARKERDEGERDIETIWHTADMNWLNADPAVVLIPEEKENEYYNYGGFDDNSSFNHVPAYKKIKYSNLYPGVDAEFEFSENGGIKYKFLVQPNAVVPLISFQWDGLEKLSIDEKGNLNLISKFNSFGSGSPWHILDHAPNAFSAASHTNIPVKYDLTGNKVEFKFLDNSVSSPEGIVIDPWITNTSFPSVNKAFDIQEDSIGNVFIIGNNTNWQVQKYNSAGTVLWTYITYAVLMGDIAVDNPGNVYIVGGYNAGKRQKLDSTGVQLWSFGGLVEEWRLAFNYSKTILSEGGYFVDPGSNNLCKLNTNTGAVSNEIIYGAETRGLATDCNGDIYSLHVTFGYSGVAASNVLKKTFANFTPAGSVGTGFLLSEAQPAATAYGLNPAYSAASTYQVFNAIAVNGPYVFIFDGATIRRINKTTLAIINSVAVPNGTTAMCGGIAADLCGNIYAGTLSGIAKFDSSLTYVSAISAPDAVYDIILGNNGDLLACGNGFVGSFSTNCTAPPPLIAAATSINASCKGGSATVIPVGGTPPYAYLWEPSGQTTATAVNLTAGTYTYIVTDPFCHSFRDTITVNQTPPLTIAAGLSNVISPGVISNESCPNSLNGSAVVTASGGRGPYSYFWNTVPVQNTQTAVGLSAGRYLATVVDADTCRDTISIVITRKLAPIAGFSNTTVCKGNTTQFTDSSIPSSGTLSTWKWDFGNSTALNTNQSPSCTYLNGGNYNVTLIVNNSFGCADTITKSVQVYYKPTAGFTFTNICLHDTMHFLNTSSVDPNASIAHYSWTFGDAAATDTLQNPDHYYTSYGTFNVRLLTTTADMCADTSIIPVKTFDAPHSMFTYNNVCLFDSAKFTNTSLSPSMGSMANWSWDFGDGSPLNTAVWSLRHLYAVPGNYQVTLITHSSNLGCPDTLKDSITVYPMPLADFNFTDVCLHQAVNFLDASTVSSGTVTGWSWSFGDGITLNTSPNPAHLFILPGTYGVSLIASTNRGCKDTVAKNAIVHPLPAAIFKRANVCDGAAMSFTDLSTIAAPDAIPHWTWSFGDGTYSSVPSTSHLYLSSGVYPVQLLVVSNFGCADSVTKISFVNPNPIAKFTSSDTIGCAPLCMTFQNLSSISGGNISSWAWSFGDGSPAGSSQDISHCYRNDSVYSPNLYTPSLKVTSDSGCVTIVTKNNYITTYPKPKADFKLLPETASFINPLISITDLSAGADFWNWNFGDLQTSVIANPLSHTYGDTGTYLVTLITSTQFGCFDTTHQSVTIEPDFLFYIPNAFTPDGDGVNDTFTGKGIFIKEFEMSIFDRWGNLIFFSDDINKPWDGRANHGNEIAQSDVYIYSIKVTDIKRQKHLYKGTVTLVR